MKNVIEISSFEQHMSIGRDSSVRMRCSDIHGIDIVCNHKSHYYRTFFHYEIKNAPQDCQISNIETIVLDKWIEDNGIEVRVQTYIVKKYYLFKCEACFKMIELFKA